MESFIGYLFCEKSDFSLSILDYVCDMSVSNVYFWFGVGFIDSVKLCILLLLVSVVLTF